MHSDGELVVKDELGRTRVYVPAVCLINTKHPENGAPALCTFIRMDQKVDLAGGEEFMVCWAPKEMMKND